MAEAPRFPYPSWVAWLDDIHEGLAKVARAALVSVAQSAEDEQENTIEDLEAMDVLQPAQHVQITS